MKQKNEAMKMIHGAELANREGLAEVKLEKGHDKGEDALYRMQSLDKSEVKKMLADAKKQEKAALEEERQRAKEEMNR